MPYCINIAPLKEQNRWSLRWGWGYEYASNATPAFTDYNDLRISSKRRSGAEKKGLWSVSIATTSLGGHRRIMASCCSCFTMWSLVVFMYTRGTAFTALSAPSSTWPNLAVLRAAGHGRSRMDASVESCRNVVHGGEFAETCLIVLFP